MTGTFTSRTGTFPEEGIKAPCVVSTSADITLSGEQTIGSTSVVAGNRVLVRSQTETTENGIWLCAVGAWTRPTDWDSGNDVASGMIATDAANAKIYIASFTGSFTAGTTPVTFTQMEVSGAGTLSGDNIWTGTNTFEGLVEIDGNLDISGATTLDFNNSGSDEFLCNGITCRTTGAPDETLVIGGSSGTNKQINCTDGGSTKMPLLMAMKSLTLDTEQGVGNPKGILDTDKTLGVRIPSYASKAAANAAYTAASATKTTGTMAYNTATDPAKLMIYDAGATTPDWYDAVGGAVT